MKTCFYAAVICLTLALVSTSTEADAGKRRGTWSNLTTTRSRVEFLENPERKEEKQPDRVIRDLGIKKGDMVADVGCGTGHFTFKLASQVGDSGKVYAVDILDEMLAFVKEQMVRQKVENVTLVKSTDSDPRLPPNSCDKILMVDSYAHIKDRPHFLKKMKQSLKKNGTVAIISMDRIKKEKTDPGRMGISLEESVVRVMEAAGFKYVRHHEYLNKQIFLVFQ